MVFAFVCFLLLYLVLLDFFSVSICVYSLFRIIINYYSLLRFCYCYPRFLFRIILNFIFYLTRVLVLLYYCFVKRHKPI